MSTYHHAGATPATLGHVVPCWAAQAIIRTPLILSCCLPPHLPTSTAPLISTPAALRAHLGSLPRSVQQRPRHCEALRHVGSHIRSPYTCLVPNTSALLWLRSWCQPATCRSKPGAWKSHAKYACMVVVPQVRESKHLEMCMSVE